VTQAVAAHRVKGARAAAGVWSLWIEPRGRSGAENMAIDAALLKRARSGEACVRLYRWDPPCLSLGRNEPALARYDRTRVSELGIDVVRRPTGGRAVWHEHEVTYAVAAPVTVFGSLKDTYIAIHAMLARALHELGVSATLAAPPAHRGGTEAGPCFATAVGGEVLCRGRKLIGSAQVRIGSAFLQHGSILLTDHQQMVMQLMHGIPRELPVTSLATELGRRVEFDEVTGAIACAVRAAWPGRWRTGPALVQEAPVDQYRDERWTWRR
jgi:lipoate-protein ligase A